MTISHYEVRFTGEHWNLVTAREAEIMCLVAAGHTNAQVGRRLHISHHTVAQHVADMLRRCGARSRCELVARAYAAGCLSSWPPQHAACGCSCSEADPDDVAGLR